MTAKSLVTVSLDNIVSKLRVHDVVTAIFVHDVLTVVIKANGFGADLVLTLDPGRAFKHELGEPAGVTADGFLHQTNIFNIMAKRMCLNAKLVFFVEDTGKAKSRPFNMVIAPPNTRLVVFAFERRHPAATLEPWFPMLAELVVSNGIKRPGRYLLGGQAVNMVSDPTRIAEAPDIIMEMVFGIFSYVSGCLEHFRHNG